MSVPQPHIVSPDVWGARQPTRRPILVGRPVRIIVHHTDGHAPAERPGTAHDLEAAVRYARMLQADMIDRRGWNDSGHNFLVMRSGLILVGRRGSLTAVAHGRMVESAHCPGQNDQPGIEHEHTPGESLTGIQWAATVDLMAWICDRCGIRPTELYGHSHFYATSCPSNLLEHVPLMRQEVALTLNRHHRGRVPRGRRIRVAARLGARWWRA